MSGDALAGGAGHVAESVPGTQVPRISVSNADIAGLFSRYATLLEIDGANVFRVRAYQNAARLIEGLARNVADMLRDGEDLTELEGIGADLAAKIEEIVRTERLAALDELERRMPAALVELTSVPGLGPKRVKALYDTLEVRGLDDLERAARSGRIASIRGFGTKTVERILRALDARRGTEGRVAWLEAERAAAPLVERLRAVGGVEVAVVAGSFRRGRETVGDVDILVSAVRAAPVMDEFLRYGEVREVVARGPTRSTVRFASGLQVDLRVVARASYGAALMYFTGSKAHNIALRSLAAKRGWKLNEYGLFEGRKRLAGRTEDDVYRRLGFAYIAPELREDGGEIEAARAGALPPLVALEDIRGDLHCHTNATDGADTLEAMARAAEECGYEYLAISDHTRHLRIANGLDPKRLARELRAIDRLNGKLRKLTILKSAEVDILEDGSLDLPDGILRELDLVVGAIHDHFGLPRERQTARILRAMDHRTFNILAHPTGRLLGEREGYALDIECVMRAAAERGCFLEVNAQPKRRDLADAYCRMAKESGVKVAISTDAHSTAQLGHMRLGVIQARRGWLGPDDVLNTRGLAALRKFLKRT
jgi:DNA polymerase (family 10)